MSAAGDNPAVADFRDRLGKLVGMLGSDRDGERANAARMIGQALANSGLTWAWLAELVSAGVMPGGGREKLFHQLLGERLADGLQHAWAMGVSESFFVRNMAGRNPAQVGATEASAIAEAVRICDEARRRAAAPARAKPARS